MTGIGSCLGTTLVLNLKKGFRIQKKDITQDMICHFQYLKAMTLVASTQPLAKIYLNRKTNQIKVSNKGKIQI